MSHDAPNWPDAVRAVMRHQLRLLLYSRVTLVFQLAFLISLPAATFLVGDFFAADRASLDLMLGFLPWVALIFIPALTMKALAGRALDREREFMLTLPLPVGAIVVGAWLAGSIVLVLTLVFTAPFAATIFWLGSPDAGVVAAGYLGAALLLVSFYAVGLFACAIARSETGAFVIAVAILFVLLMTGWDGLGRLMSGEDLSRIFEVTGYASPKFWMERIAAGRVELRAIVYFAGLTGLALLGAAAALNPDRRRGFARRLGGAAAGLAIVAATLGLTAAIPSRASIDLTASRSFTLSDGTLDIAARLPKGSRIDFYWSGPAADTPSAVRAYAGHVAELLREIADRSGGALTYSAHEAVPDAATETPAIAAGIRRVPLSSGDHFFLGASFSAGERRLPIAYFDQRREGLLEYDIATALAGLGRTKTPRVAIVTPLIPSGDPRATETGFNAIGELRRAYDVAIVPAFADRLPDDLDAIVVMGATFLKREMLYSIDQAVVRGAGLIAMIDPRLRLSPSADAASPTPSDEIDDISDLLARYGLRYLGDQVVGDATLATPVANATQRTIAFPYWMGFSRRGISRTHAVTANLGDLLFVEAGAFEAPSGAALVTTTDAAGAASGQDLKEKTPAAAAAGFAPGGGARVIAAEVDGPFDSAFVGQLDATSVEHLPSGRAPSAVYAIGDVDWILDPFAYQEQTEPDAPRLPRNDNVAFFLNMVERAAGGGRLIGVRSRGDPRRPLTRIADMARALPAADRAARMAAATRIAEVEKRIASLPAAAGVADVTQLPSEVQERVAELRSALTPDRRKLRDIDRRQRKKLEKLRASVTAFNLIGGPALALSFAGLVATARRRRSANL